MNNIFCKTVLNKDSKRYLWNSIGYLYLNVDRMGMAANGFQTPRGHAILYRSL